MNMAVHELVNTIFKKPLHECGLDELRLLAQQYPYFGPAQLLLAKKISIESGEEEDNSSLYEEQVQKTSLYFQNRVWLHHLLNDSDTSIPVADHSTIAKKEAQVEDEEQYKPAEAIVNENMNPEMIQEPVKEETAEPPETAVEIPLAETETVVQPPLNEPAEIQLIREHDKEEKEEQPETPVQMPSLKFEPITANTGVLFEPFHTVDYFASQGIRFKEDEKPKDRFGVQLKSFTEWLKTMKRIPATEIPATSDTGSEKKVEQMAEFSIAERHIITEAMAEVWQKQGNKDKAEDIYHKLSLLDPSKSSYFAAKIEDLKKTS
jgi:hypothetical protein